MTTVSKNGARRFKLAFWQKLLLILGSTLLCGLAAFVLCQFILTPTYTDAVKVTFDLGDRATAISLADEKYVTEHFDLFATLNERLANDVPSRRRGDKSAYYFEIADALKERGLAVTPRDLAHMVNVVPDTADAEGLTMQIKVSGTTAHRDPDELQIIAEVAYEQFGAMIFGTLPLQQEPGYAVLRGRPPEE